MKKAEFRTSAPLAEAGFVHAFFSRNGGVSDGAYESLNFSYGAGDSPENVRRNLGRAADALGVDASKVYFLSQVHGTDTVVVDGTEDREEILHRQGDAIASTCHRVAVGVRVADCVPILLGDRSSGAALAVHAGWRGAAAGIVGEALRRIRDLSGDSGDWVAAIGPHISVRAFEVGEEVAEELAAVSPVPDIVERGFGPKPHVDLRKMIRGQLTKLGLADADIDDVDGCTVGDPDVLFSYRRDGKRSGRHLAAIVPKG